MALAAGARLGPYEILSALGVGGMGEVYRARDTRLNRDVAIKILLPAVANDPDRLERFQREAEVLASLNHPNIATIYGLEESSGTKALALELVEGPTLEARLANGAVPVEEALSIARQIADALEGAHEKGIIHRDLKPGNIKLTAEGAVKVLDFGLAKTLNPTATSSADPAVSPTITARSTRPGIILGTAAYMSPEQARGGAVDRRADVWAFGAVLFEMLTGRRAFEGHTVSDILAAVLKSDVDWAALPVDTPPSVRILLRRCLEKEARRRLQSIGEARILIEDVISGATDDVVGSRVRVSASLWRGVWPWASLTAALLATLGIVLVLWVPRWPAPTTAVPQRLSIELGVDASIRTTLGAAAALSPDGALLAFAADRAGSGGSQLYLRRLESLGASPLAGTDGARHPFFSPDGEWIAFFARGKLKKIAVAVASAAPGIPRLRPAPGRPAGRGAERRGDADGSEARQGRLDLRLLRGAAPARSGPESVTGHGSVSRQWR